MIPKDKQPYTLPDNWQWTPLKEVAEIIMGQSPKGDSTTKDSSYTPLIGGAADMGNLFPVITRYTKKPTKLSQKNDVIICVRATIGKPIFSDDKYCLGRGVAAIRPRSISKEFLRYLLINFEQYFYDKATGSTFSQVSSTTLKNFPVPLPPLDEQQRIVALLDEMFYNLDEVKALAQNVVDSSEFRRAAILHKAFTGELTENWRDEHGTTLDSWERRTVASVCKGLLYGTSKKSTKLGKMIVLRMGNLQCGEIDWTDLAYSDDENDIKKYRLSKGDVLFNRTNSAVLVGKTSIYRGEYPAIYAGYLIKLDYDHDILSGEYLNYVLNSPNAKEYYNRVKTDGVNQSNINARKIGEYVIPLPPLDEQKEIVRILDDLLGREQRAKDLAGKTLDRVEMMKKSILARAFRGEQIQSKDHF